MEQVIDLLCYKSSVEVTAFDLYNKIILRGEIIMAKATPEIIKASNEYTLQATLRSPEYIGSYSVHDAESDFTCFHTGPKPPNRDLESFVENMRTYKKNNQIANSLDFDSDGWVVGDVAWVVSIFTGVLPDGTPLPNVRTTTILRLIDGEWKVAHLHLSEGVDRSAHMWPKE